jgi:hypothetical protein
MTECQKSWVCSKGCNLEELGRPCQHLESLLPPATASGTSKVIEVYEINYNRISSADSKEYNLHHKHAYDDYSSEDTGSEYTLRDALSGYSLDDQDKDFLVDYYAYSMSLRPLMTKYGIKSWMSLYKYRDMLFNKLKSEGFSLNRQNNEYSDIEKENYEHNE